MDPASSIRRLGFRKWYERELIKSHAALVTCLLCGITIAAVMEEMFTAPLLGKAAMVAVVIAAAVLGWLSWRGYITMLQRAEYYGESSTCPACGAYGRFKVLDSGVDTVPTPVAAQVAPLQSAWLKVQCRMCEHGWRMPK